MYLPRADAGIHNRLDEIYGVVAVFLNTGANSENIGVKTMSLGLIPTARSARHNCAGYCPLFRWRGICLTVFIKRHNHYGGTIDLRSVSPLR